MRECQNCGADFGPSRSSQLNCSSTCRRSFEMKRRHFKRKRRLDLIKMGSGCALCGYDKHPAALDFNHLDPATKKFSVSSCSNKSWDTVLHEVSKCEVLCANCHRIHSYERGHGQIRV